MNKRFVFLLALIFSLAAPSLVAAQDGQRVVLFQIGAGAGFPSYPSETEAIFSYAESQPGVDRVKVSVDIALGLAVSQQAYLMARADGIGDRISYGSEYIQMNLLLYSLGFRFYPSSTGFYLEGGAGASKAVAQNSMGDTESSDSGFGWGAAVGYDFNKKKTGFGLCIEAKYDSLDIEGEQAGGLLLSLNLCWK